MNAPARILVVKLSSFGDLFHALPAVHNLKAELGSSITWVTQPEYVALVQCFTDVDRVLAFPRRDWARSAGSFLRELRAERFDMVVDLQGLLKSALVALAARSGRRIGPSFEREGARFLYTEVAGKRDKDRHAVEENLDVLRHLGLRQLPPEFPIRFPDRPRSEPGPRIAVFPVSRWVTKNWPARCYAELCARLQQRVGGTLFLMGGPDDRGVCDDLARSVGPGAVNLAGTCSLVETGSLLRGVDLVISNDSGPIHMAAALGIPVLALFGPTNPKRTGPYGSRHRVIVADPPCEPCLSRDCRRKDIRCMNDIPVDTVEQQALVMLSGADAANAKA